MPTIGNTYPTLVDLMKRQDPDHKVAAIIEIMSETNEVLDDAIAIEGNLPTGHRTTVRTGLPSVAWRMLNYGVPTSKSTTMQVDDRTGMLEAYAEIDKSLADLNGNSAEFRLSEDAAFLEAMNQNMVQTLFYGNTNANPERFLGLAPRFSELSADRTQSGSNIIDGGGLGTDNTSIWFVTWGDQTGFLTYPKGTLAGFQHNDLGEVTLQDQTGGQYQGYRTHYKWDVGFVLRDWRGTARIANIDASEMQAGTVAIEDLMIDGFYRVRKRPGKKAIYCNEAVQLALHKRAKDQANVNLSIESFEGKEIVKFLGIPVRQVDEILNTEARVI